MLPYIVSQAGTITVICKGQNYSFDRSSLTYERVKEALNEQDEAKFLSCIDHDNHFRARSHGKVTFEDGVIRYNGAKVDNSLSRRILELYEEGFNFHPLMRFLENCYQNPNPTVVDRLYGFMQNNCIMLDPDGYIVGFKKVRNDNFDFYSGTVLYKVGTVVSLPLHQCSFDTTRESDRGLHIGSKNYAENIWYPGSGKVLLLRVHPKDIVCVPETSTMEKMRASQVEVLEEYEAQPLRPVYMPAYSCCDYDEDYDFEQNLSEEDTSDIYDLI